MPAIASGIEERKTDTGSVKISSVELTLLDLLHFPQASAGLDNISTVFPDVGPKVDRGSVGPVSRLRAIRRATGRVLPGRVRLRSPCGEAPRINSGPGSTPLGV